MTFADGGQLGGGGNSGNGGVKPIKDGRIKLDLDTNITEIDLSKYYSGIGGNAGGGGVKPIKYEISNYDGTAINVLSTMKFDWKKSKEPKKLEKQFTLPLNQIEEVTLKDGTVISTEEILERIQYLKK